jgi:hypothetical protein
MASARARARRHERRGRHELEEAADLLVLRLLLVDRGVVGDAFASAGVNVIVVAPTA